MPLYDSSDSLKSLLNGKERSQVKRLRMTSRLGEHSAFRIDIHPETSTEHVSFMLGHSDGLFNVDYTSDTA